MSPTPRKILASLVLVVSTLAALPVSAQWRDLTADGQSMSREDFGHQQAAAQILLDGSHRVSVQPNHGPIRQREHEEPSRCSRPVKFADCLVGHSAMRP
jgi:hypothetical protein